MLWYAENPSLSRRIRESVAQVSIFLARSQGHRAPHHTSRVASKIGDSYMYRSKQRTIRWDPEFLHAAIPEIVSCDGDTEGANSPLSRDCLAGERS